MEEKVIDIKDLVQDDKNFNKGTEEGRALMEQSFSELGAGRSILIDKNNRIIAGNKSQEAAIATGIKRVRIVETTGDELVAVKRVDVDLDSEKGRTLALADNATQQANLAWDETQLQSVADEIDGFDCSEWGVDLDVDFFDTQESSRPLIPLETKCRTEDKDEALNLPPELRGIDLKAQQLPKIEGDDATAYKRIIIIYSEEEEPRICSLLGQTRIDRVSYRLKDLNL